MNTLFKKHFWVMNLVAIAGLAWVSATAANEVVAGQLFAPPRVSLPQANAGAGERHPSYGRITAGEAVAEALTDRRVFDLDPKESESEPVEEAKPEEPVEEPKSDGTLEESELPVNLMGTMVSEVDPESSIATLEVQGENKLAWVGSQFLDGGMKVLAINPRHIVIDEAGRQKVIKLWTEKKAKEGPPGREGRPEVSGREREERPNPAERTAAAKPPGSGVDYAKAVTKTGAYDYEIKREMLDEQLQDLSKFGAEARVVPNYRGGKYQGFKLVGVRPGSLYRAIGIRSGDVIKSVNGNPIDSPNKALELFEKLKTQSAINLEIERRGQPKELNYSIK